MDYSTFSVGTRKSKNRRTNIPLDAPIKLAIFSIASITLIVMFAPTRVLNTPGFVSGALGILYAIVPGYTTYYWVTRAVRRISKEISTTDKFKITGVIVGSAGIIGIHLLMMWKLCSVPMRGKNISIFWRTILSNLFLFIVWESKNRSKSQIIRDILKILFIVLLVICITCYLSNLVKMFGRSDLRMFTVYKPTRTNVNAATPTTTSLDNDLKCPICLEGFSIDKSPEVLSCGHSLHKQECFPGWKASSDRKCPVCRAISSTI